MGYIHELSSNLKIQNQACFAPTVRLQVSAFKNKTLIIILFVQLLKLCQLSWVALNRYILIAFDEAIALPTETSARIARNTQLILKEDTGITKSIDPLAGSYYIEALTGRLIASAEKIINNIEELGGMTKAVEKGIPKQMIEELEQYDREMYTGYLALMGTHLHAIVLLRSMKC